MAQQREFTPEERHALVKMALTEEEIYLGRFYAWIIERSEFLREREKAAADQSGKEERPATEPVQEGKT